jgi:hypothetical protein
MARGYLGKISAVVAVNTDDARAKLSASAKDFTRYARSVQSTIGSATTSAGRSLDAIFTPLQRVQRALAATQNGSLGRALNLGIDQAQVTRIQQFVSASELLQKPLAAGVSEFIKLSRTIQGEFQPALVRAQEQVVAVRAEIARVGQVSEADFAAVEARVNRTTQAMERLAEVSRLVQNASVPNSIRVTNPQQFDALARAGNLQQRSAALSAQTASSFGLNAQQSQIEETSKRLARQLALRERLNLEGKDTSGTDQAIAATTQKLTQQLGVQENLVDAAERYTKSLTQAASTSGPQQGPPLPPGFGGDSRFADFGLDLDDPRRQLEVLKGSVVSLKGQLDTLPAGIRAQFIPAIQQAEANLQRLAAQPAATAAELRRAARELELLNQGFNRARQASNIQSFRGFTESLATRGALGELQALQQILSRIQAQAGGPAAQAYDRYAAALRRAVTNGTTQLPQVRRRLEELQVAAARAAAETGRISFDQALREIRRGGDIARGGFDRVSLAVQQAAFAIDDFFSSTGDFTQRIRAVQNNVTQLAFILGGTRGLFIGLGVAIAAQATVALINWVNGGRTAEDQTRALNDALARQKSLVDELAQAFESLGDTIADRAFSESARAARSFSRQLEDIQAQQRDLRQERLAAVNPNVQRERAEQNRISRALDDETNVGRRIILERELEQSRRRERQIVSNLRGGAAGVGLIRQVVGEATLIGETFAARQRNRGTPTPAQQQEALARTRQEVFSVRAGSSEAARRSQAEALRRASERLVPASRETFFGLRTADAGRAADRISEIEALIRRLEDPVQQAIDDLSINLVAASQTSSRAIEQAQSAVAEAILQGVPSARILDQQLNTFALQLERAFNDLEQSRQQGLTQEEQSLLQSQAERRIRDITGRQQAAIAEADSLRREATLNPERQLQARIDRSLQTLQSLSSSGFDQPDLTRAIREIQFQRETLRQQSQLFPNDPVLARAAAQAEAAFSQQVDAISQEVEARRRLVEQLERERAFDEQVARRRDPEGDAVRGLDLFDTPAQRAAREAEQGILDIAAAFDEQIRGLLDANGGLPNADILAQSDELRRQRDQAAAQFAEQQQRAAAPAIFNLADSVENAILQGPSRAALNASDISTQEGARELNRLLRGEDSARDQNLVELQNQSQELRLVNQRLTEVARQVGVAL